jgi:hypothetical protein
VLVRLLAAVTKYLRKQIKGSIVWWLMLIIPAILEVEIGRIMA